MRREVRPVSTPTLRPRDVDVEDSEGDGETLAPVDDTHQVGVLHVVIGFAVALAVVAFEQNGVHGIELFFGRLGAARRFGRLHGEPPEVAALGVEGSVGTIDGGKHELRLGDIDRVVVHTAEAAQRLLDWARHARYHKMSVGGTI